ncbi:MAG: cytochrome c oxidase subunit 3, partial [Flavobacteriaceae bacterium]
IKGDFGALETKGGRILQFVDIETGERVALRDFAIENPNETAVYHESSKGIWFLEGDKPSTYSLEEVKAGFLADESVTIRTEQIIEGEKNVLSREDAVAKLADAAIVVEGANLIRNEYGSRLFADFFFFITGFHGFHVLSGVAINVIIFFNVLMGTYDRRGHYEMVEKVGLYWHFVDLVWVFVFTFFYLV